MFTFVEFLICVVTAVLLVAIIAGAVVGAIWGLYYSIQEWWYTRKHHRLHRECLNESAMERRLRWDGFFD